MPANAFQQHLAEEAAASDSVSPRDIALSVPWFCGLQADKDAESNQSTTDSLDNDSGNGSNLGNQSYCFKNSFVHFKEADAESSADARIITSMPEGKFVEALRMEKEKARALQRPSPICMDDELESRIPTGMTFPSTPDAENNFDHPFPFHQSAMITQQQQQQQQMAQPYQLPLAVSMLSPALWTPTASASLTVTAM